MRGRDAVLLREGEQVARVLDLPWEEDDPGHWDRAAAAPGRVVLAGKLGRRQRRRGDPARAPVGGRRRLAARDRAGDQGSDEGARIRGGGALVTTETYGAYGGRYVPETLIPALDELTAAWADALADETYRARAGRARRAPTRAGRRRSRWRRALRPGQAALPQARGSPPHRRAQAEQRARPGGARAAARQAADRRRDGRGPARCRHRDRLRPVRARVRRLHGLRGHAPPGAERRADGPARRRGAAGRVRDEDPEGGDERGDPRLDHERRDDALPDRLLRRPRARTPRSCASCRP